MPVRIRTSRRRLIASAEPTRIPRWLRSSHGAATCRGSDSIAAKAVEANAWFAPALAALSLGERSMCNWDEDTLTLAVEAGRDCLGEQRDSIAALHLASTTAPFADRQNAALVAGALGLDERIGTLDIGASQRAGTSGLVNAFASAKAGKGPVLLIAAEDRLARAGGAAELRNGAGAAALLVGEGPGAAELIGSEQSAVDFVDHFRSQGDAFDYAWEERWVRDAGYFDIVPRTLQALLKRCDVSASSVDHFVMPCTLRGVLPKVAARVGLPESSVRDPLDAVMGEAGTAHALVLLAHALESAAPGEIVLVAGFGQGCDALLLRTTERVAEGRRSRGVSGHLARRREESQLQPSSSPSTGWWSRTWGMRAEAERPTLLSTLYRNRDLVTALVGGKCRVCGTAQLPRTAVCVNPNCGDFHTQDPYPFAERSRHGADLDRGSPHLYSRPACPLRHRPVRGRRTPHGRLHRRGHRGSRGRDAGAHGVPDQRAGRPAQSQELLLEGGARLRRRGVRTS